jgi:alpha-L-rhamnosidase
MSFSQDREVNGIQKPAGLRCEYAVDPHGIDVIQPRFSWVPKHTERASTQSAYRILVASTPEILCKDTGDIWDSKKVKSAQSVNVEYSGKPLAGKTIYCWKIKWWDNAGQESPFSDTATFEMGLLSPTDWQGKWIGGGDLLRKQFAVGQKVKQARAYICGLGWYELRINGQKVGDSELDPGQTDYDKSALYSTFDATGLLQQGENALGVMLGNGRYAEDWSSNLGIKDRLKTYQNAVPKVIMQLEIHLEDGSLQKIATDLSWKTAPGPITGNDIYDGENYDARLEKPGWDTTGYDDSDWQKAAAVVPPEGQLVSQGTCPPIKKIKIMQPVIMSNPRANTFVYDFGQNFTGWVRLIVSGPRGTEVKLRFAELLQSDCNINVVPNRTAKVTDTYILKGEGVEVYEPRFTYHGFRYVELTGYPGTPNLNTVQGIVVHSAVNPVGGFQCSNQLINSIHQNVLWTQLSNLMSIPTDCPQRNERMGWLGDAQLVVEESIFNFDMAAFYTKWLRDIRESQKADGSISDVVPPQWQRYPADPPWGTACVVIPWYLYLYYDDVRVLAENYKLMKGWVDYLTTISEGHTVRFSKYGDWCPPSKVRSLDTPGELISTWCYYHDLLHLAKIAGILGKSADAEKYAKLSEAVKKAFNREFLEEDYYSHNSRTADALLHFELCPDYDMKGYRKRVLYSQTANVLPLYLEMTPENKKAAVSQNLFENVEVTYGSHLNTGILGTRYLLDTLTKYGRSDLAYSVATQTTYPSWGYMIKEDATTLWERWEYLAGGGMNSHNHIMFGSVDTWFYRMLAGINPDAIGCGFRKVIIKPYVPADLDYASASVDTIRGLVSSSWRKQDNALRLDVTLPVNSIGKICLPSAGLKNPLVKENGKVIYRKGSFVPGVAGITGGKQEEDYLIFDAGSGDYSFWIGEGAVSALKNINFPDWQSN